MEAGRWSWAARAMACATHAGSSRCGDHARLQPVTRECGGRTPGPQRSTPRKRRTLPAGPTTLPDASGRDGAGRRGPRRRCARRGRRHGGTGRLRAGHVATGPLRAPAQRHRAGREGNLLRPDALGLGDDVVRHVPRSGITPTGRRTTLAVQLGGPHERPGRHPRRSLAPLQGVHAALRRPARQPRWRERAGTGRRIHVGRPRGDARRPGRDPAPVVLRDGQRERRGRRARRCRRRPTPRCSSRPSARRVRRPDRGLRRHRGGVAGVPGSRTSAFTRSAASTTSTPATRSAAR